MTEVAAEPNSSLLSDHFARCVHRHRRSAAVSGDFDAPGSPWGISLGYHATSRSLSNDMYPDKPKRPAHSYSFSNLDDFAPRPPDTFAFPLSPHRDACTTPPPMSPRHGSSPFGTPYPPTTAPKRALFAPRLDSPIRMAQSPSRDTSIPNPIIDLDDALKPRLTKISRHLPLDALARSPVTPLQLHSDACLVDTVEEENDHDVLLDARQDAAQDAAPCVPVYTHDSCVSSMVSLRAAAADMASSTFHDDTLLLDPPDFDASPYIPQMLSRSTSNMALPKSRRLGAKASRYLSFYDQSNRLSNALKVSSLENVNLTPLAAAEVHERRLGHSSSLPILEPRQAGSRPAYPSRLSEAATEVSSGDASPKPVAAVPKISDLIQTSSASPISAHSDVLSSTESIHSTDRLLVADAMASEFSPECPHPQILVSPDVPASPKRWASQKPELDLQSLDLDSQHLLHPASRHSRRALLFSIFKKESSRGSLECGPRSSFECASVRSAQTQRPPDTQAKRLRLRRMFRHM